MNDCLFCKIVAGQIPAAKVYEDDLVLAFNDIHPAAPTHMLIIPKEHFPSLQDIPQGKLPVIASLFAAAQKLAETTGIAKTGYRTLINTGPDSGQVVFHVHLHLLGGRKLGKLG
ncbi:MAG: histidine triad nucleotide-binding protein [Deltaproteobacteria bacterium]|nr:histidine triad nucleotide-binding protein [Deltaproteobacteria bacterium]